MTYLVERLVELRKYLEHAASLKTRVTDHVSLAQDLSLHNDVLFSLLTICQLVIDIAGELSARRGDRFEDYTQAVRNLAKDSRFPPDLVRRLEPLPGFRNIIVHEYVELNLQRAVDALAQLDPIERFLEIVRQIEAEEAGPTG